MQAPSTLPRTHARRLREVWRSSGWPWRDMVEADLLAGGWLERRIDTEGRETLHVTDAGVRAMVASRQGHRSARQPHEALVQHVAALLQREGRLVWLGLSLRAPLSRPPPGPTPEAGHPAGPEADARSRWVMAIPDVFSIRHTTLEDRLEPVVHEIKVRRADLLSDLRKPDKRDAYLALSSRCWYVLAEGVGEAHEVPAAHGVILARAGDPPALEVVRPAPVRPHRPGLAPWMALARAHALPTPDEVAQGTW